MSISLPQASNGSPSITVTKWSHTRAMNAGLVFCELPSRVGFSERLREGDALQTSGLEGRVPVTSQRFEMSAWVDAALGLNAALTASSCRCLAVDSSRPRCSQGGLPGHQLIEIELGDLVAVPEQALLYVWNDAVLPDALDGLLVEARPS